MEYLELGVSNMGALDFFTILHSQGIYVVSKECLVVVSITELADAWIRDALEGLLYSCENDKRTFLGLSYDSVVTAPI